MGKTLISSLSDLEALQGREIGVTDYFEITQEQIQRFADATNDHQWIHVDPERASRESPFKATIAHGYLTLSLAPFFLGQLIELKNVKLLVNYGIEKLRFSEPVVVNSKIRFRAFLLEVKNLRGTAKCTMSLTIEIENKKKPAATADVVYLYQFD